MPEGAELTGARDRHGLIVQAHFADGSTRDVGTTAELSLDKPVATATSGFLAPAAGGTATLTVKHAGHTAAVPVSVNRAAETGPLRFRTAITSLLSRVACHTGKGHGGTSGKDGFRLSLFGYDPEGDHFRLTREMGGRRVNLASPDDCLLVNKATGRVPRPTDIEVFPREAVFAAKGETQRVVARAKYSDGTDRDVTRFTVYVGNNHAATVAEDGTIAATGPGEAFVLARLTSSPAGPPSSSAPAPRSPTRSRPRSTTSTNSSTRS